MSSFEENFIVATGLQVGNTLIDALTGNVIVGNVIINGVTGEISTTGVLNAANLVINGNTISSEPLSTVATTGSYNDLLDIPAPPAEFSRVATTTVTGLVKVGSNIGVDGNGSISLVSGNVTAALGFTPVNSTLVGNVSGIATLDSNGKVPLTQINSSIIGAMNYQGTWNASTNIPAIVSSTGTKGHYYTVSVAGTTTIDGNANWTVGDIIAFNGTKWDQIQGSASDVISVAGLYGAISASGLATALSGQTMNIAGSSTSCTGNAATATTAAACTGTHYVGTTAIAGNRASAAQALTGITSIDGSSASCTGNAASATTAAACSGNAATATTAAACTGTHYVGTTAIAGNRASATQALTGITSIDGSSASCTGNAATATTAAACSGNSVTATTLATTRNITLTGDVTGTATFNGSADASITAAVADNSHNHTSANISDATDAGTANMIVKRSATGAFSCSGITTTGDIVVGGNLIVQGTSTTINTATLDVVDLNITIAKNAATAAAANGAGLTINGAAATMLYGNTNDNFTFNKRVDATSFYGAGTGLTGTAASLTAGAATTAAACSGNSATATTATTATNATNCGITNDVATATSVYPTWVTANTGNLPAKVSSTKLSFVPSTGVLTATSFTGAGTGLTGSAASLSIGGSSASCTGNAASATTAAACSGNAASATTAAACTGTHYVGTTAIAGNRASATQALTGITSIDGSSASCTGNAASATTAAACTGTHYVGTTAIAGNRASAAQALTGITSIDGSSASCTGNAATATTATNATNCGITNDVATATSVYPTWVTANTGNLPAKVSSTKLSFVPSTGVLTATSFTGAGTGLTGTAASLTAGAATTAAACSGNTAGSAATFTSTTQNSQFNSIGVGTAASATAGEIRATNNVVSYYSDDRLKTKLGNIEDALTKLCSLNGFYYEANETAQALGYEAVREIGVSAQEVNAIFPEIVSPAPIDAKYMTVRYERLAPLFIEAIKELLARIDVLEKNAK